MEASECKADWALERERRLAHLDRLPGKRYLERFESLNRASHLFSVNGEELRKHIAQFVGTAEHVNDLPEEFEQEAIRLFHNYLASVATLRDIQRATHRKLWPQRREKGQNVNKNDQSTDWEVEVYRPKVHELFGDDDIQFLFQLRNCTLHHTVPIMTVSTTWSFNAKMPMQQINAVQLKRSELEKFSKWNVPAKRFLETQEEDVDFLPLLEKYSIRAREFYGWFWDRIQEGGRTEIEEYFRKRSEFYYWLKEELVRPDFEDYPGQNPIPGSLRRNRAKAHSERSAYGTTGWGGVSVDTKGVAVVGESNWPPLPAVGKYRKQDGTYSP